MYRKEFLTTLFLALAGHSANANLFFEPYPNDLLFGKGNPDLSNGETPLIKPVQKAFDQMAETAKKENITLKIVSGYRSFERQKHIWNRKYFRNQKAGLDPIDNIKKIITFSTLPGTSRHHWGTEVDLIDGSQKEEGDVLLTQKFQGKGPYVRLSLWMQENASQFGFYLPYTNDKKRKGFSFEPWHYSYAPLSIQMLKAFLKLDLISFLKASEVLGKEVLDIEFISIYIEDYIKGINPVLL
tara:strand:- start:889 stop:1611 length:723 start_codon:yes stop_codon:yes gene_type:complete